MSGTPRPARMSTPKDMAERDLRFADVATQPRTLRADQVAHYNLYGYVHPLSALSDDNLVATRSYFDHLFTKMRAEGITDSYALVGYHSRCPGLYDLAMSPAILDVIKDIVGPDILCWSSQAFAKMPGDTKSVPFHQDGSYWPLTPARTVTAWVAIDDSDCENSCLQVIPGTHKLGQLPWRKAGEEAVLDQQIEEPLSYGAPVSIELKAGQFSIHSDMIAHGSEPNKSDRRRCGFAIRYCAPMVKPLKKDWARNAILCRGTDNSGHWTYWKRPEQDDVSSWRDYWMRKYREGKIELGGTGGNIGA